jgi:hypothetical protein
VERSESSCISGGTEKWLSHQESSSVSPQMLSIELPYDSGVTITDI